MKTRFLIPLAFLGATAFINAQDLSKNVVGLRLGDSGGLGLEVSYQHILSDSNRLEFGLNWQNDGHFDSKGVKINGLYQWTYPLAEAFNWYVGAGGGLESFKYYGKHYSSGRDTFPIVSGVIGIAYSIKAPLSISLDLRPELGFGDKVFDNNDLDFDIGFSIRYRLPKFK